MFTAIAVVIGTARTSPMEPTMARIISEANISLFTSVAKEPEVGKANKTSNGSAAPT